MNEFIAINCPSCGKENHISNDADIDETACEFCHNKFPSGTEGQYQTIAYSATPKKVAPAKVIPYSSARPFWYVALMMVMTFGLYMLVWFYRAWSILLKQYQLKGDAAVNAVLAPLTSWSFFRYAFSFGEIGGFTSFWQSNWSASLYFWFTFMTISTLRLIDKFARGHHFDQAVLFVLSNILLSLTLIPLRDGVKAMNAGYALIHPNSQMRTSLSPWSTVFLTLGFNIWVSVILICLKTFDLYKYLENIL